MEPKAKPSEFNVTATAEYLKGRNNPWRVSMTFPSTSKEAVDGVETIHTRVDAKNEKLALAEGYAIFMRALGRRGKGQARMRVGKSESTGNREEEVLPVM